MSTYVQDLRYALRILLNKPAFTIVTTLVIALGIGVNTAIFSVINSVLLRPLPYEDPDGVVQLWESTPQGNKTFALSLPNFVDWSEQNQSFEHMAIYLGRSLNLTEGDQPERVQGVLVSPRFFPLMRTQPLLGRAFSPDEAQPGKHTVAILSHGLWQRRFGADAGIIEKTVLLNGVRFTIVGVMPESFQFPDRDYGRAPGPAAGQITDLLLPLAFDPKDLGERGSHFLRVLARLKPGVSPEQAQAEMDAISSRLEEQYPESNKGWGCNVVPIHEQFVGDARPLLLLLVGAVVFVLLIACANIANLLLVRASTRSREMAIRLALGAGRRRLIRQLLVESLLLAILGGAAGLLLAFWGGDAIVALSLPDLPRVNEITIDYRALVFTAGLSILTGLLFGLAPALQTSTIDLNESLKEGSKGGTSGVRRNRFRGVLVISEIALSLVLLIMAGLLVKSFVRLVNVKPGFNPDNLLTVNLSLPFRKYSEPEKRSSFFEQVIGRLESTPGVESVGATSNLPLSGSNNFITFIIEGRSAGLLSEEPAANWRSVSTDYFRAMGMTLLDGRGFTAGDRNGAPEVIIINEAMANQHWPGESALGKRIVIYDSGEPRPWREIVGIVNDIRHFELKQQPKPEMYVPHLQRPQSFMTLVTRLTTDEPGISAAVREAVFTVDKDQPIYDVQMMNQLVSASLSSSRSTMILLGIFAAMALGLAAVGIYGVMAFTVAQRTNEIGIRMALGARASDVVKMVLRQGLTLAVLGVCIGLGAAFALTRLMKELLYSVSPIDPWTFVVVAVILAGVAMLACFIPARRASKVDPMIALRYE